jgi:hypothetical protein
MHMMLHKLLGALIIVSSLAGFLAFIAGRRLFAVCLLLLIALLSVLAG